MNDFQPCIIENPGRILVIGDIHGDIDRLLQTLIGNKIITQSLEWIAEPPNTIVIQVGDQIDSMGRAGFNADWDTKSEVCKDGILDLHVIILMDKLDTIAIEAGGGGRVISLIGNHELLNILQDFTYVSPCSMRIVNPILRKELLKRGTGQFAKILAKRNVVVKVGKYLFCHGGILPEHLESLESAFGNVDLNKLNTIFRKFVLAQHLDIQETSILINVIVKDSGILWTRFYMHVLMDINIELQINGTLETDPNSYANVKLNNALNSVLLKTDCQSMFIGHTIVEKITSLSNNRLFFVDAALSRAFDTTRIQVLEIVTKPNGEDVVNLIEIPCMNC